MKRTAVISDIHANLAAFETVLDDIRKRDVQEILFTGDVVGYGPDPDACIRLIKDSVQASVAGNHDWAVIGRTPDTYFNEFARRAVAWTRDRISQESVDFIKSLDLTTSLGEDGVCLVHGSPNDPGAWHYLFSVADLEINFPSFSERICFVGHSHVPFIAEQGASGEIRLFRDVAAIAPSKKYIVNAGSVGQPRDSDPRACYVLAEHDRITIIRVEYDILKTQQRMAREGLPTMLIERLSHGM